ncbi:Major facilitator superfamily domain general substrate transporter [Penicillium cf. griseofulvum]|uniref:Major facilitator superfamily domain general substrate transporter n=1 Tax=Penicillium cf. griseofulvum TaxID=2972120 RepID=A0A9W9JN01_9EURO|nr:Major facilitator superfamily domain general substrate transporter [Penicillium cf. griseofulvum]KAJ5450938.1 Major facilitator superfamily domain general substrate transporter [Penicillium cf. griseofulvum]
MAERASISASSDTQLEKRVWYRGTLFNACVIGAVGFTAPGLWNAMNALGAGGAQEPFLINAANALVFGLMGILCLLGGPIANRIGLRWTLMLGAVGYPLYSAALYTNNRFGNVWFVLVGSALCGLSAGLFWASEGAVALGYPEPAKRGRYMNIWLWFRTGGPLLGGAIVLGLNHAGNAHAKGKVGSQTYLIFVALQCTAVPIAFFLTSPDKVQRTDGSKVRIILQDSWRDEMKELWKVCKRREILLLLPVFWAAYFNMYTGNFKTYYFGVRARALIGFVTYFATLLASTIISRFLDYRGLSIRNRIKYSFFYVIVIHIVTWVYCWVIQEKYTKNPPTFDWADKGFVEGFFVILLWEFAQQSLQNFLYYLLSTMTDNISELSRLSGILRGQESFSQAVSYGLNSKKWHGGRVPLIVNTILLVLSVWPTWLVVRTHVPIEHDKETSMLPQAEDEEQNKVGFSDKETFIVAEAAASK